VRTATACSIASVSRPFRIFIETNESAYKARSLIGCMIDRTGKAGREKHHVF
jgi:hypothetical protein